MRVKVEMIKQSVDMNYFKKLEDEITARIKLWLKANRVEIIYCFDNVFIEFEFSDSEEDLDYRKSLICVIANTYGLNYKIKFKKQ